MFIVNTHRLMPADFIDPEYGKLLRKAAASGVELLGYGALISSEEIRLNRKIPVQFPEPRK